MSIKWKREDTELLITTMQQHPCLYNIRSTDYLDRTKKALAFNNVLDVMRKSMSTINVEDVRQKWRNVRTQYVQEMRMVHNSKKSDVYISKLLWCFDQLSFLKTNTKMRESEDNVEETLEDSSSCVRNSVEDEHSTEEPPKKKQKRVVNVKELRSDLESFKAALSERKQEKKFAWLGMLVATQMERVHSDEQDDAAWQVQCLMRKLTSKNRHGSGGSCSTKDILEQSMDGAFEEDDFV